MSWTLAIRSATGTLLSTVTDATSPPVTIEAPQCLVDPPGACQTMTLLGRPDQLAIPTRGIIEYSEDGNAIFFGPAIIQPNPDSPGAGPADKDSDALQRYTIAGGAQLVDDSLVEGYLLDGTETDVAAIALELCTRYAHPALTVASGNFPSTGRTLTTFYSPERKLSDALDELAKTVSGGATWWVDAAGATHFQAN